MALPRIQEVLLPILRDAHLEVGGVEASCYSWIPDVKHREFPMLQVRRLGGFRHKTRYDQFALPVVELTAYTQAPNGGLEETEHLYESALDVLYLAVKNQTQTEAGYLHSIKETFGSQQFSSLYQDSWRIQGLIQFGLRPPQT